MSPRRGEVWVADLGYVEKTRPVIVISKDDPNPPRAIITYIPITSENRNSAYEVSLSDVRFLDKESVANTQAVGTAPKHRFLHKKGDLPQDLLKKVEDALLFRLDMGNSPKMPDANLTALKHVEDATDSKSVSGEELLESEELKRQLREAKEREQSDPK